MTQKTAYLNREQSERYSLAHDHLCILSTLAYIAGHHILQGSIGDLPDHIGVALMASAKMSKDAWEESQEDIDWNCVRSDEEEVES